MVSLVLFLAASAHATDYSGGDWAGADLILADGDRLDGTFTNVGRFEVPAGARVRIRARVPFEVHAQEIVIDGDVDALGSGRRGGRSAETGVRGKGPGGGDGGGFGEPGGGGAFAGSGGGGPQYCDYPWSCNNWPVLGGTPYSPDVDVLGSGGGGGSAHYNLRRGKGGAGGGAVTLVAPRVRIDGGVWARGVKGGCPDLSSVFTGGGGGGGSGGLVRIATDTLAGAGVLSVRGGGSCGQWAGGGGGGGWVVLEGVSSAAALTVELEGGISLFPGGVGRLFIDEDADGLDTEEERLAGTDPLTPDTDGDGLLDGDEVGQGSNPLQVDTDGDGLGDAVDACVLDSVNDVDGDGVCGDVDLCPTVSDPDQRDRDRDGVGDACDLCIGDDAIGDPDGDGRCSDRDNCPVDANSDQADGDGDGFGDVCDLCIGGDLVGDGDGDGVCDDLDVCVDVSDSGQLDGDGDGVGDACDTCPAVFNPAQDLRFGVFHSVAGGESPWGDVTIGDVDLDGWLDIVAFDDTWLQVCLGQAGGPVGCVSDGFYPGGSGVALGDLDQDGDLDAVLTWPDHVIWYEQRAPWDFYWDNRAQYTLSTPADPSDVAVVDVDADGLVDVVAADLATGTVAWFPNTGAGYTSGAVVVDAAILAPAALAVVDLDGDGDADLLASDADADELLWYENLGTGFGPAQVACDVMGPGDIAAADVDGDGVLDLVAHAIDDTVVSCAGLGGGVYGPAIALVDAPGMQQLALGDLDGDGDPDLATGGAWFENLGGTFGAAEALFDGSPVVGLADLDEDGDLDAVVSQPGRHGWLENEAPCLGP